ncbi:MAG: bacteriohemerythrin [Nitrospinae bacterium]|nr:bacteriohemerythrin [Nitrospinota bacterium]
MITKWTEALSCCNPDIDRQHSELITHFVHFINSHGSSSKEQIKEILSFLHNYVVEHFALEETLMEQNGYPLLEVHTSQHREFIESMKKIVDEFKGDHDVTKLGKGIGEMYNWFLNHIPEEDKKMGLFLQGALKKTAKTASRTALQTETIFQWNQSLSCFEINIDKEHKELVNHFYQYQRSESGEAVENTMEILTFLRDYIHRHFQREEKLMEKYNYPAQEHHKKAHHDYVEVYKNLLEQYQKNSDFSYIENGVHSMFDWFIHHISEEDVMLGFYLKNSVTNVKTTKEVIIYSDNKEETSLLETFFSNLGFKNVNVYENEVDLRKAVKKDNAFLATISTNTEQKHDFLYLKELRFFLETIPVLFLLNSHNKNVLNSAFSDMNFKIPKKIIEVRPKPLWEIIPKLHDLLFEFNKGSTQLPV